MLLLSIQLNVNLDEWHMVTHHTEDFIETHYKEIPVLNVNIYIMGRDEISKEYSLAIGDNLEYLNQEFKNEIKFNFDQLFLDPISAYLPDLYNQFFERSSATIDSLLKPVETTGAINVFVFDTYIREGESAALSGFTPRLKSGQESYPLNSPSFDRIFISYGGLLDKTTLVHEMGHFLGLYHPWEMDAHQKNNLGILNKEDEDHNHMSYSSDVHEFTTEQLQFMRKYALDYRTYLCEKITKINIKA